MSDSLTPQQIADIQAHLANGSKIQAIKAYRNATGADLRDSKNFIDALIPRLIEEDPEKYARLKSSGSGCSVQTAAVILFFVSLWHWLS